MNHHRQLDRTRQPQLPAEHFPLHLSGRVIVMIVEPDLSPGDHPPALLDKVEELLCRSVIKEPGVVRMHPHGRIDVLVFFSEIDRSLKRSAVRIARPDVQHCRHTRSARAGYYFIPISVVLSTVDVAM